MISNLEIWLLSRQLSLDRLNQLAFTSTVGAFNSDKHVVRLSVRD
jgi:hypothetical protein